MQVVHAAVVVSRSETLQGVSRIVIIGKLVPLRVLLLMHHHLYYLLFIEGLLPFLSFLEVLEVFKLVACFILHDLTHAIRHGILLLLLNPVSVVIFGVSPVASPSVGRRILTRVLLVVLLLLSLKLLLLQ